jgi:nucleoside 2-deoxyribosyltransferase
MSFYLAAQFSWKEDIAAKKRQLEGLGYTVTSTWTDEEAAANCSLKDFTGDYHEAMADRDLREIEAADVLVAFSVDPDTLTRRGGRHVEFGYAMGKGKSVIVVGPKENIFHHLPNVRRFVNWESFVESLPPSS